MRFLLLLLDLSLQGIRNFKKAKRDSKILLANDKSLTNITNVISIGIVKVLSQKLFKCSDRLVH